MTAHVVALLGEIDRLAQHDASWPRARARAEPIAAKFPGGPRPFRRKCQAGHPGPTDADRHGQELINEGREVFLRLMQRS
jgi:hypothetical protein